MQNVCLQTLILQAVIYASQNFECLPKTLFTNCGFVKIAYLCAGSHGSTTLQLPDVSQHAYI